MKSVRGLLMAAFLVLPMLIAVASFAQEKSSANKDKDLNLRAYVELLRADIRAERVSIITKIMRFDDEEAAAFWPIFRQYDLELSKIGDSRVKIAEEYVGNYSSMTDEKADNLMSRVFAIERQRAELKKKYFDIMKKALSPITAARFFQVENQMQHIVDLQVSASLPTMEDVSK